MDNEVNCNTNAGLSYSRPQVIIIMSYNLYRNYTMGLVKGLLNTNIPDDRSLL